MAEDKETKTAARLPVSEETETRAPAKAAKSADIIPSSQVIGKGDNRKVVPKIVKVSNEKDMTKELTFKGPVKSKDGSANVYVTVDGRKLRFDAKSGALLGLLLAALLLPLMAFAQGPGRTSFQGPMFEQPYVTLSAVSTTYGRATGLAVNFTRGKLYLGNGAVSVVEGRVSSLTASKTDCAGPAYASCNIIYADSSGAVTKTLLIGTANSTGNTVLGFVKTGTASVTGIQQAYQNSASDITGSIIMGSTTVGTAALGAVRDIVGSITANYAGTITSGSVAGTRGIVTLGSGTTAGSGTYYYGVDGRAVTGTGTVDNGSGYFTPLLGKMDVTGGTITSGHVAAIIGNIFGFNSGTSTVLTNLYLEAAGGGVINSHINTFGKATYWADIQTNVHTPEANTTCTPSAVTGATGGISVLVDGVQRFIPLAATCN